MSPLFDDLNGLINLRWKENNNPPAREGKRRQTNRHHQRKGVQRPGGRVIVVGIYNLKSARLTLWSRNAVKMSVNDPGMVVIRRTSMDMLKRRQDESQQDGQACR